MHRMVATLARLPWNLIAYAAVALSALLFVTALDELAAGDWSRIAASLGHHGWLIGWLLAVGFLARSRTLVNVFAAVFGGFFTAIWLAVTLGDRTGGWLGVNDPWQLVVAVPLIEEVVKLVPLLVVVLVWHRHRDATPGAVDLATLGVATGAGFAIHEDGMWSRASGSGLDTPVGWVVPSVHTEAGVVVGHAVWTGLVGLALGIWLTNRDRRGAWLVPLAALTLVIVDHGFWNDLGIRQHWRFALLDGWLVAILFLVGVMAAVVVETRRVQRVTEGRAGGLARALPSLLARSSSPRNLVERWHQLVGLLRLMALHAHALPQLERQVTASEAPEPVDALV